MHVLFWFRTGMALLLCAVSLIVVNDARAAESGDLVVVVYNSRVPESQAVAEHYAKRRHVPENQVIGFDLPAGETMTRSEFRNDLQKPLFKHLEKQKLFSVRLGPVPSPDGKSTVQLWRVMEAKVRYAVLCYGVPTRILEDADIREPAAASFPEQARRNGAAVDSDLALLPMTDHKLALTGPMKSPFYGATNANDLNPVNGLMMVSRLDGPSAEIAKSLVDKAIEAEENGLWGRGYFDLRSVTDEAYRLGDEYIKNAAEISRAFGFETIVDKKPETFSAGYPMDHIGFYAGWYDGAVSGPFTLPNVEFMPGAFAYHIHSYSAATIRDPRQNWVAPLLAKGVTATVGYVDEPFLGGTLDVAAFLGRFTMSGSSLGEAVYAAQPVLSWQTTVIGDPLYRPFAKQPQALHEQLAAEKNRLIEWSHLRVANLNLVKGFPEKEVVEYLEQFGKDSPILMEKLGDLQSKEGKTWAAIHTYIQTLDLKPSSQQELRLMLTIGEKLQEAKQHTEALGMYRGLLKKFPDYPDATGLYRKMIALASQLGKTAEVETYQKQLERLTGSSPTAAVDSKHSPGKAIRP